jgi:hypothetical protein
MSLLTRSRMDPLLAGNRRERRRLAEIDRVAAHRALLVRTASALEAADRVVETGWLQDRWFAWRDPDERTYAAGSAGASTAPLDAVTAACLVGALVAGSRDASPVLRSSVEATWHALRRSTGPVDWIRSPAVAESHVRELTFWNDRPGRSAGEVRELLERAHAVVARELDASAGRLAALASA